MTPHDTDTTRLTRLEERLNALEKRLDEKTRTDAVALKLAAGIQDGLNKRLFAASGLGATTGSLIPYIVAWFRK